MLTFLIPIIVFLIIWMLVYRYNKLVANKPSLKQLKLLSLIILISGVFGFLFFIWNCFEEYYLDDKSLILNVHNEAAENTFKKLEFAGFSYSTGNVGKLFYTSQSIFEQILFYNLRGETIIHVIFYLIISLMIFNSIRNIPPQKTFTPKITKTFMSIAILLFILPLFSDIYQSLVVDKLIQEKTGNMFSNNEAGVHNNVIPGLIFLIVIYFMNKGTELQKEQDLTI